MDYKKFFLSDNKSGNKTREDFIKKNYKDIFFFRQDYLTLND